MANYILSNNATEDLIRIYLYGAAQFGVTQADRYYDNFFKQFELIAKNPYSFEAVDHHRIGYRRCPCGSDTIYFKLQDEIVEILAIVGQQDIDNIL